MAFYANKVDLSHYGRYQFDKIFSSRAAMDKEAALGTDGLFAGRFALVSYSPDPEAEFKAIDVILGYRDASNGIIYADIRKTQPYIYTEFTHLEVGNPELKASNYNKLYYYDGTNYIHLASSSQFIEGNTNYYIANVTDTTNIVNLNSLVRIIDAEGAPTGVYYKCTGGTQGEPAIWSEILLGSYQDASYTYPDYLVNFNLDRATYGDSFDPRGYDGTVWQKVFSDGYGKFILIGRAIATLPAMELFPDPPRLTPNAPYIDALSSDQFYRIHVPSMWGFQLRQAVEGELSDQTQVVTRYHINDDTGNVTEAQEEIPVGIYFNKAGMDFATRTIDRTTKNEIQITPTGESGKVYYDTNGVPITEDMLELTIHTPAFGNMVAEGYDIIYGPTDGAGQGEYRPRDVEWINGDRSPEIKIQGENQELHGKTHELKTLAGVLNTMHDRLGQIVMKVTTLPSAGSMSPDLIYEYQNRFYRRSEGGTMDLVGPYEYSYTQVPTSSLSSLDPFPSNKYFTYPEAGMTQINNATELAQLRTATSYDANNYYYLRNLNKVRYNEINPPLIEYQPSTYFRKISSDYILDTSDPYPIDPTVHYYYINDFTSADEKHFTASYTSDGSFFTYSNRIYTPYREEYPQQQTYYKIQHQSTYTNKRYYHPGIYYYLDNNAYIPGLDDTMRLDKAYFIVKFKDEIQYGLNENNQVVAYRVMESATPVEDLEEPPNNINNLYFIDSDGRYVRYTELENMDLINGESPYAIKRTYYSITTQVYTSANLFLKNMYYIKENGSYLLATEWSNNEQTPYYELIMNNNVHQFNQVFYIPDKYYYEVSQDHFALAKTAAKLEESYYTKISVYVDTDTLQQCPHGFEWNDNAPYIPPSISLYRRTEVPAIEEITGIANGESTINGLLLELHKQLDFNNLETRNITTFRGCLNELGDMLYRLKDLQPGKLLIVNDFGQIESISLSELKTALNAS